MFCYLCNARKGNNAGRVLSFFFILASKPERSENVFESPRSISKRKKENENTIKQQINKYKTPQKQKKTLSVLNTSLTIVDDYNYYCKLKITRVIKRNGILQ